MYPPEVALGIRVALEAHRQGALSDEALDQVLRYYDAEGGTYPAPAIDVLVRLGGLEPSFAAAIFAKATGGDLQQGGGPRGDPTLPTLSPRLTVLERIGAGGMGAVFRAHDRVLGRDVAVKLVHPERLAGSEATRLLARFAREAKAMARVRHPAVVPLHDAGLDPQGRPYLVMEFVAGQSLARAITEGAATDWRSVAAWGRTLAEALQACHDVGLVHRDVKPANVLIDEHGRPHLTDFGVALDTASETRLTAERGALVGTLAYMAPEQFASGRADARSDVYALGATLYEALSGQAPFEGQALVLMRDVLEREPTSLRHLRPALPEDLETVVSTCLAKSPDERYTTAQALALDLARVLADEPVAARRPGRASRLWRFARRRRRGLLATAVALAVSSGLLAGYTAWRRSARRADQERAIEHALRAVDDLTAAVEALGRVAALAADPDLVERARAARRVVRGRQALAEAAEALTRFTAALERADALQASVRGLGERLDEAVPYAESPEKQERVATVRRVAEARRQAEVARVECERALVRALAEDEGAAVHSLRAELLVAQARRLEESEPDLATALFEQAQAADVRGDGRLRDVFAPARIALESAPAGEFAVMQFVFDTRAGHMRPGDPISGGTTPASLELPAGEYLLELKAVGYLSARLPLLARRGSSRTVAVRLISEASLGPARDLLSFVPGGIARWGDELAVSAEVADLLMRVDEVTLTEWSAFTLAAGERPELSPVGWGEEGASALELRLRARCSVFGVTRGEAVEYLAWLDQELARARVPYRARLPRLREYHRAARGELPWVFPWGRLFDASFCACSKSAKGGLVGNRDFPVDSSAFLVRQLAGSVAEFVEHQEGVEEVTFGGDVTVSASVMERVMKTSRSAPVGYQDPSTGFRYVLVPRDDPLPEPPRDMARVNALVSSARAAEQRGDLIAAYQLLTSAIDAAPLEAPLWNARALARHRLGDTWGAIWDCTRALDLQPAVAALWINRARARAEQFEFAEAVADLGRALDLYPALGSVWAERARCRAGLQDLDGAISDLQEALRREPTSELASSWRSLLDEAHELKAAAARAADADEQNQAPR